MNFHLTPNKKVMTKFLEKLKKPLIFGHFGSILLIFGQKWIFLKNSGLSLTRLSSTIMQKNKKQMSGYVEKVLTGRQRDGRTSNSNFIESSVYGGPKVLDIMGKR